jgi:hypothetical protein
MRISNRRARCGRKSNWYASTLKFCRYYTPAALFRRTEQGMTTLGDAIYMAHLLRVKDAQIEALQERIETLSDIMGYDDGSL